MAGGSGLSRGWRWGGWSAAVVEKGLQNQRGGDLIDDFGVVLAGVASLVKKGVGFLGGEALVPEVDGQAGERAELGGEGLDLLRPRADFAGEMEGQADDDGGDAVAAAEAGDGAEGLAGAGARVAVEVEGEDGLGGEAELVGDGDADAARADVEGQVAGWLRGFQRSAPG